MVNQDGEFLKRLLALFRAEADEHMRAMSAGLIGLEQAETSDRQAEFIEIIFREAHSLKGAARTVNLTEIEAVCQALESALARMKRREFDPSAPVLDALHQTIDGLNRLLAFSAAEAGTLEKPRLTALIHQIANIPAGGPHPVEPVVQTRPGLETPAEPAAPTARPALSLSAVGEAAAPVETVRIATNRLDSLFLQVEELLSPKLAAQQRATELRQMSAMLVTWKREWAQVRPMLGVVAPVLEPAGVPQAGASPDPRLGKLLEFAAWNQDFVVSLQDRLAAVSRLADADQRALGELVDGLLRDMKQVLLMPFASLLEVFPMLVRELARDQGKEVDLVISGADIEMDRRILQEIKDPLIHLVRNCLDHGIERPDERLSKNKPARGTVTIAVTQQDSSKVEVTIADDGAGIDAGRVRDAAVRLGLTSAEVADRLSEREGLGLIFMSGLSTSPLITDLSGRGLGLAIVQEKVERLGGAVSLETLPRAGTTFRILLPLTLATMRGLLVSVNEQRFVLPTAHVDQVARVARAEIQTVENRETIVFNAQALSLVRLADALGLARTPVAADAAGSVSVVILRSATMRIAFAVDEILGEQEVLVKQLGPQLARVRNIAGATVLGTGQLVPILNVSDLMKSAIQAAAAPAQVQAAPGAAAERKSILVVEDSITTRTLLKNLLESAGYHVQTAVDGLDGFTKLRTEPFDLVVTDVDMPRLSGFDLTMKIRADTNLADMPVVLVTALESRQDKERGVDVGANAYIVKRSFDQSNLLEVIQRLI